MNQMPKYTDKELQKERDRLFHCWEKEFWKHELEKKERERERAENK